MPTHPAYDELHRRFARLSYLGDALALLDWDTQTMMPEGAGEARAEQTAGLRTFATRF